MGYGRPVVQAEANDSLDMLQGDNCLALVGRQSARCFVGGDVPADAVHVQQAADLADLHFEVPVHLQHHSPVTRTLVVKRSFPGGLHRHSIACRERCPAPHWRTTDLSRHFALAARDLRLSEARIVNRKALQDCAAMSLRIYSHLGQVLETTAVRAIPQ